METGRARKTQPFQDPSFRGSWSGYERDVFFVNPRGQGPFIETSYSLGVDFADDGRAVAPIDFDGDGDLDMAMLSLQGLRLLENTRPARRFARVRLEAVKGDRHALGAIVTVEAAGVKQQDYVKATTGFATQVPFDLHFGLRDASRIDRLTVKWPDGSVESLEGLPVDRLLTIRQGAGRADTAELPRWPDETRPRTQPAFNLKATAERVEGGQGPIVPTRAPVILNFWSPSCAPCRTELPALAELSKRVHVVGISAEWKDRDAVKAAIAEFKLPYPQFYGDPALMTSFFGHDGAAPMPSTFVFDAEGRLRRAYYRPVEKDELAKLLDSFTAGKFHADHVAVATFHMSRGEYDAADRELRKALAFEPTFAIGHFYLGVLRGYQKRYPEAVEAFKKAIEHDPDYTRACHNLAVVYKEQRKYSEAEEALRKSIRIEPGYAESHLVLGHVLAETGRLEQALAEVEEGVRLEPKSAQGHTDLGRILQAMGRTAEADRSYARALEIDPQHAEARSLLNALRRPR